MRKSPDLKSFEPGSNMGVQETDLQRDIKLSDREAEMVEGQVVKYMQAIVNKYDSAVDMRVGDWKKKNRIKSEEGLPTEKVDEIINESLKITAQGGRVTEYPSGRSEDKNKMAEIPYMEIDGSGSMGLLSRLEYDLTAELGGRVDVVTTIALRKLIASNQKIRKVVEAIVQGAKVNMESMESEYQRNRFKEQIDSIESQLFE